MTMLISAGKLQDMFVDSLFVDEEVAEGEPSYGVEASGVMSTFVFHPARLESYRHDVEEMLKGLPKEFEAGSGDGGWSFLQACMDREGGHWGEHRNVEQLMAMGIALGYVRMLMPREMWKLLPGGMPYFSVDLSAKRDLSAKIAEAKEHKVHKQYTREELIAICEQAIVPESEWRDRDSQESQTKVGMAWALLKAGCEFRVLYSDEPGELGTDDSTIWIETRSRGFSAFEYGTEDGVDHREEDTFYLPTPRRLKRVAGKDWY